MYKLNIIALALIFISVNITFSKEYQVESNKKNLVKFISNSPLEDFEGITDKIDGYLKPPDENNLYGSEVYFEVDLNSVNTGIGLRNRHMRENYLHTDKFQYTYFKGKINEVKKEKDNSFFVKADGEMFIHGVTRNKTVTGILTFNNKKINVKSNFSIKLSDYNIEIPKLMFLKISEEIKLVLDFNLVSVE